MSFEPVFCRVCGRPRDVRSGHAVMSDNGANRSPHEQKPASYELVEAAPLDSNVVHRGLASADDAGLNPHRRESSEGLHPTGPGQAKGSTPTMVTGRKSAAPE